MTINTTKSTALLTLHEKETQQLKRRFIKKKINYHVLCLPGHSFKMYETPLQDQQTYLGAQTP